MKKPKMILFDYGQTLVNEKPFDGVKGTEAVLKYATANKYNLSAEEIQREANAINKELGRFDPARRHLFQVEVPNHMFTKYLYESVPGLSAIYPIVGRRWQKESAVCCPNMNLNLFSPPVSICTVSQTKGYLNWPYVKRT